MLDESDFKRKALKKAKEYFKDIHMTDEQYKIFLDIVQLLHQFIPIGEEVLKGILWRSISLWQKDYNLDFLVTAIKTHEDRLKALTKISDYVKIELVANLINSEYESKITEVIDEILKYYDEKYANI